MILNFLANDAFIFGKLLSQIPVSLHKVLEDYLKNIELALLVLEQVYVERYTEEILTPTRVNLRLRIRSHLGYLLEINEAVIVENGVKISVEA